MVISLPSACSHGYIQHTATPSPIFSLESQLWAKVIALWHSWLWVPLLLVLATEVVKHMIAGPSHSPVLSHHLTPKVPAEEASSLGWGHPTLGIWSRKNCVQTPLFAIGHTSEN